MNACHFLVTFIVPIPLVSVPITTVLPLTLSLFLRYYRNFRPHYRGFTAVTADLPLSPSPCSCLVRTWEQVNNKNALVSKMKLIYMFFCLQIMF